MTPSNLESRGEVDRAPAGHLEAWYEQCDFIGGCYLLWAQTMSVGLSGQGICDSVVGLDLLSGQVIVCVSPSDYQNWGSCGPGMLSLGDTP